MGPWTDLFIHLVVQALAVVTALVMFFGSWVFLTWASWRLGRRRRQLRGRGRRGILGGLF